ncbi:MAG: hypothetical protein ACI8P5_001481, partial [Bacteroidia bacterium]
WIRNFDQKVNRFNEKPILICSYTCHVYGLSSAKATG